MDQRAAKRRRVGGLTEVVGLTPFDRDRDCIKDMSIMSVQQLTEAIKEAQTVARTASDTLEDLDLASRNELKKLASKKLANEVFITIYGESGSGKTTLFNSLIGQYGPLSQSAGGEACTSVPAEIRGARDPKWIFDVEVEYIDKAEFREDILAAQKEMRLPEDDAESNRAEVSKLEAVFPGMTRQELCDASCEELLAQDEVSHLIGRIEKHKSNSLDKCSNFLAARCDSAMQLPTFASWPLVKVARLWVQSPLLSGKLVLVDVPGFGDSNKARNARSKEYLKKAAIVCVVVRADRGGTNAALPTMIRDALEDMHFSGRPDKVALISTMSDVLSSNELTKYLDEESRNQHEATLDKLANRIVASQDDTDRYGDKLNTATEHLKFYKLDLDRWRKYRVVHSKDPMAKPPTERVGLSRKFIKADPDDEALDSKDVDAKIEYYRNGIDRATKKAQKYQGLLNNEEASLAKLKHEKAVARRTHKKQVVSWRNHRLKKAQLKVYLGAIKSMDLEAADAAIKDESGKPLIEVQTRDYNEIGKRLPVFCTSARAYLHMMGFTDDKPQLDVCESLEDTGIPEVARYLQEVEQRVHEQRLRDIYDKALIALTNLSFLVTTNVQTKAVDPEERQAAKANAEYLFDETFDEFMRAFKSTCDIVGSQYGAVFGENIAKIILASPELIKTEIRGWTKPPKQQGLYYSELKAAVRRHGTWNGSRLNINLSDRMRLKMQKAAKPYTDQLFANTNADLKNTIGSCCGELISICEKLHAEIKPKLIAAGVSPLLLAQLDGVMKPQRSVLQAILNKHKERLCMAHSESSADLTEDLKLAFGEGYLKALVAKPADFRVCAGPAEAMSLTLQKRASRSEVLDSPVQKWDKRMRDYMIDENTNTLEQLEAFAKNLLGTYRRALDRGKNQISSSDDPAKDAIRLMIIATRMIADDKLGVAHESADDMDLDHEEVASDISEKEVDDTGERTDEDSDSDKGSDSDSE